MEDRKSAATPTLTTAEWFSSWQTNDPVDGNRWATEIIVIKREKSGSKFSFHNKDNDLKYAWHGSGENHRHYYMSGTWVSAEDRPSAGSFMLHSTDSQGTMKTGFLLGPTKGDRKNFGAWVLVRKDSTVPNLAAARGHLEAAKRHLAISMCPGLGEMVKYSDGQFIEQFLHPALQPAFALLKSADAKGAVGEAFSRLEHYVSSASGVSGVSLLDLMLMVFKPGSGELSNGTSPQGNWFESSSQARMRDLFTGSLYVRNLYEHNPPKTSFAEAVGLLMLATYLYGLVDAQVVKRGKPPVVI